MAGKLPAALENQEPFAGSRETAEPLLHTRRCFNPLDPPWTHPLDPSIRWGDEKNLKQNGPSE